MARQPQHLAEQQQALGRYLAALREAAGLYQSDIARAVPCHRTTVTHAEAGSQLPGSYFWEIADRIVGANGALIASYNELVQAKAAHLIEQQAKRRARAQVTARQPTAAPSPSFEQQLDAFHAPRETVRQAASGKSVVAHHQDNLATGALGGNSEDMMRRELLRLLSMVGALVTTPDVDRQLDGLNYSSSNLAQLDHLAVDEYAMLNENLWRVFVLSKSKGAVLPLVRSQLDVLTVSLNQSRGPSAHQRLCKLASELLQLAGEIFFDANKYTDAAHCYTLAATASREADAFDLWACAMARHAFIEIYERRFEKAVPMLELAVRLARRGDGSLSTRYWVSAIQAQAFAGLGELDSCQRALDRAEQVHELSGDVSNGGWLRFDSSRLAEERGACYVELRCPNLAETTLSDALRQNLSARRRGSVLTDLAMIGVQRGDVDQLVTYADAALEIAVQTGSGFISHKLQGLQKNLAPLLESTQVRQLNQQITTLSKNSET